MADQIEMAKAAQTAQQVAAWEDIDAHVTAAQVMSMNLVGLALHRFGEDGSLQWVFLKANRQYFMLPAWTPEAAKASATLVAPEAAAMLAGLATQITEFQDALRSFFDNGLEGGVRGILDEHNLAPDIPEYSRLNLATNSLRASAAKAAEWRENHLLMRKDG